MPARKQKQARVGRQGLQKQRERKKTKTGKLQCREFQQRTDKRKETGTGQMRKNGNLSIKMLPSAPVMIYLSTSFFQCTYEFFNFIPQAGPSGDTLVN